MTYRARLTSIQDLDPHFMSLRRGNLNVLDFQRLASSPADSGLAVDNSSDSVSFSHTRDDERG